MVLLFQNKNKKTKFRSLKKVLHLPIALRNAIKSEMIIKCKILLSQEANSTFRILLNESTRRLKLLSKKLGSCIEKARPFYEAQEKARMAQIECQAAAVKFQRANGNYNTKHNYNLICLQFILASIQRF